MNSYIHKGNLEIALRMAIDLRKKEEKEMNYFTDSALVKGWEDNLKALTSGHQLEIKE